MQGLILRKFLSAMFSAAIVAGLMVMLLDEGPVEAPYYEGGWTNPINTPQFDAFSQGEGSVVSEIAAPETTLEAPAQANYDLAYGANPLPVVQEVAPPQEGNAEQSQMDDASNSTYFSRAE
jgi:hypothetical protein